MKKLLLTLFLLVPTFANAGSNFTPLDQIDALRSQDDAVWAYSLDRCGALYLTMGAIGQGVMQMPKKDVDSFLNQSVWVTNLAAELDYEKSSKQRPGFYPNLQYAKESHKNIVIKMAPLYMEDLVENKTRTGDMFNGNFAKDLKYCQRLSSLDGRVK